MTRVMFLEEQWEIDQADIIASLGNRGRSQAGLSLDSCG